MSIQNCRGDELKSQIVAEYDLACTSHLTLLDGQDKDGCCGRLTDEYYYFEYTAINGDDSGGFFVGRHCALKFAELADIDLPPKFNPLKATQAGGGGERGGGGGGSNRVQWHQLNCQLYNAIHVILTMWNKPPKRGFRKIIEWLRDHPDQKTQMWPILFVHEMVVKFFPGQTLTEAWNEFREDYPSLKEYSFHLLAEAMENEDN